MAITIPDQTIRNSVPAIGEALITLANETETAIGGGGGVPGTRQVIAGAGMTGGGALSADVTLNVIANADASIVVNANDIQVGVLASDAQHGNRGGGGIHAVATGAANGFMSSTDKSKLDSIQGGTATLVAGTVTVPANITASSRIPAPGITAPGAGAITGLAGFTITNKVVGAPGSFDITAIDDAKATIATAVCVVDWIVVG
jgi:hypothetical protein